MPGPKATARFCGIVHGVVVQITTRAPSRSVRMQPSSGVNSCCATTGKPTQIMWLVWSWYSTSASASAVCSTGDHITGFEP